MKFLMMFLFSSFLSGAAGCNPTPKFSSVDAAAFAREIANERVQLIDVRTPEEFAEGHIAGAVNMNVHSEAFAQQIATLDSTRPVALYCRSGRRSKRAAEQVTAAGYQVIELDGGILSWKGDIDKK